MEKTLVVLLLCALSSADGELSEGASQSLPCLSDVHAVLRNMSGKLGKYEVKMEQLQKDNQEQAEQLKVLQKELEKQTSRVGAVTEQVGQVAFSASLSSGEITLGPFDTHSPLVYRHVVTNIGNAYNSATGVFTAPLRGAYRFDFYIVGRGYSAVVLVKNDEHVFAASKHTAAFSAAGNGVTLLLEVGDRVFMRLWARHAIFNNENHHSTFSGHLLFTV